MIVLGATKYLRTTLIPWLLRNAGYCPSPAISLLIFSRMEQALSRDETIQSETWVLSHCLLRKRRENLNVQPEVDSMAVCFVEPPKLDSAHAKLH